MKSRASITWFRDLQQVLQQLSPARRRQLRWLMALMVASAFGEALSIGLLIPFLTSIQNADLLLDHPKWHAVLDALSIQSPAALIGSFSILFMVVAIGTNLIHMLAIYGQSRLAAAVGTDLSAKALAKVLDQPYTFHVQNHSIDLSTTIQHDVATISSSVLPQTLLLGTNLITALAILATLLVINVRAALAAFLAFTASYVWVTLRNKHLLRRNTEAARHGYRSSLKILQAALGGIKDILLDGTQSYFVSLHQQAERPLKQAVASTQTLSQIPRYLLESMAFVMVGAFVWLKGSQTHGVDLVPTLGAFALGGIRLLLALQRCYSAITVIDGHRANVRSFLHLMELEGAPRSSSGLLHLLPLQSRFTVDRVTYTHPGGSTPSLEGISLVIEAHAMVGFVGESGSGKTTLANLIMGLLYPNSGELRIDGTLLTPETAPGWQKCIAHVPQDIFIVDGTFTENIAFGVPPGDIDPLRVAQAARWARLEPLIQSRPGGYDAKVGERGTHLSGGQRQRIGIARALYKNASLIVFDEATSALDTHTEQELMESINSLRSQVTIVLIAHRISTVQRCDRIFEFSAGRLVASGTYTELLASSPGFRLLAGKGQGDAR